MLASARSALGVYSVLVGRGSPKLQPHARNGDGVAATRYRSSPRSRDVVVARVASEVDRDDYLGSVAALNIL